MNFNFSLSLSSIMLEKDNFLDYCFKYTVLPLSLALTVSYK